MTDHPRPPPATARVHSTTLPFDQAAAAPSSSADTNEAQEHASPFPSSFVSPGIVAIEIRLSSSTGETSSEVKRPVTAADILHDMVGRADREHFVALYLNARHCITHAHVVSRGTTTAALVHPREVFKGAILANAAAVIVGHNHPTGDVQPSLEDKEVFKRLQDAGKLLGITVLDALIVGPTLAYFSHSSQAVEISTRHESAPNADPAP